MDLKDIKNLISVIEKANISSFSIEQDNIKIEIKKEAIFQAAPVVQNYTLPAPQHYAPQPSHSVINPETTATPTTDVSLTEIKSPMVGTFYYASSPDTPPFVKVGDAVIQGQTLCIIEAMKLFNEIESEFTGTIEKVLLKNGEAVEYGQPLFLIKTA